MVTNGRARLGGFAIVRSCRREGVKWSQIAKRQSYGPGHFSGCVRADATRPSVAGGFDTFGDEPTRRKHRAPAASLARPTSSSALPHSVPPTTRDPDRTCTCSCTPALRSRDSRWRPGGHDDECTSWLYDTQMLRPVVFVAFGSFTKLSRDEVVDLVNWA